ncbi:tRNA pseudouridine synthase A [Halotydeus destructor]|nr:tRNA pseudouridine synthase A [Halotydeus destructor]
MSELAAVALDEVNLKRTLAELDNTEVLDSDTKKIKEDRECSVEAIVRKPRVKSHKWAVLLSYCGTGYHGLQRNNPFPTIEEDLLIALKKKELIDENEYSKPQIIHLQRAARTDKGVSAARQILSVRLPRDFPERIAEVNKELPEKIRIIAAKKTTKYFDCKNYCDGRTYAYMMPSYALCPPNQVTCVDYRLSEETLKEFNQVLAYYIGTHNFHNFTSQKDATDASAQRYIISMECGQPFVKDGIEFVVVRVKGQSFMLHQIRKMVAFSIAVVRGFTNIETLKKTFHSEKIDIPKAPGLGLMLEQVHYDKYNERYGGDGEHEEIIWTDFATDVNLFKDTYIYPEIVRTEKEELSMLKWLETLPLHTYGVREPGVNPRDGKD